MAKLIPPSEINEQQYKNLINEFAAEGEALVPSALDQGNMNFHDYINRLEDHAMGINLPANYVPATTYFLAKDDGYLIGATNIRHQLNEFLRREAGHIGYGIRTSSRGSGYGTKILALALEKAKDLNISPVLVICDKNNTRSASIIQKHGGFLDSEIGIENVIIQRYLIKGE